MLEQEVGVVAIVSMDMGEIVLVAGGGKESKCIEVEDGFECVCIIGKNVGREESTFEIGHEHLVDGGGGGGSGPKDEVSTLTVPVFLIWMEDGNEGEAKIFDSGGGGYDLK